MSGEVRKRKDKKKRKDDSADPSFSSSNEDVNIHVYKEDGTGGNICAKIVFVLLFSALIVLVGLIIRENQGLNELENVEVESRFSQIFEGWVEKSTYDEHDDDHSPEDIHSHEDEDDEDDDHHYESEEQSLENSEEQEDESQEYEEPDESVTQESEEVEDELVEESVEKSEENLHDDDDSSDLKADESDEKPQIEDDDDDEGNNDDDDDDDKEEKSDEGDVESEEVKKDEEDEESKEKVGDIEPEDVEKTETQPEEDKETTQEDTQPKENAGYINVEDYEHSNITNEEDYQIKDEIDNAQEQLRKNAAFANKLFEALVRRYPFSPRSLYGKAQALDILAEENKRNDLLEKALAYYIKALEVKDIPEYLFKIIGERYIDRTRFMGQYNKALVVHWKLIHKFPDDPSYLNMLAVTYLTINYVEEARSVLKKVLTRWPNDGFALVHYGFILKTTDNLLQESVNYMSRGLKTKAEGVVDGRFYFHLGDALSRLNKAEEAMKVYEEGVKEHVFLSKYQRSLYNIPRLTGKPWWESKDLPAYQNLFKALKDNWLKIRREGLAALNSQGYFQDEAENLKDTGTWKQFELFARGRKSKKNCDKSPITCSIIQSFPDASSCKRGQTKFSVMHPKTHVWPHCGPTNCRLRLHLGLKVPPNTFIRVAEETRSWKEGDIIIFDDSFEHEVWHNGSDFRLVLIVDIWHPELTKSEKLSLSYI